jgi:hypothetical protein
MRVIATMIVLLGLTGCASVGISNTEFNQRMRSVSLGVDRGAFLEVFPEAEPRGAKAYPTGSVEVLEVWITQYAFVPTGAQRRNPMSGMEGRPRWFYFFKDKLVQYGEPNDWPTEPDKIIEIRQR